MRGEKLLNTMPGSTPSTPPPAAGRAGSGWPGCSPQRLVMVAVVPQRRTAARLAVRHRVLREGEHVREPVDRVAVARQRHRAVGVQCHARVVVVRRLVREPHAGVATGVADRLAVCVTPVAAELERVVAAKLRRQEVVAVEVHAVDRTDEHALAEPERMFRPLSSHDEHRLHVGERGLVEIEDEVVADVGVVDLQEHTVRDDPLVAELVGRRRPGVPVPLPERRRHRCWRCVVSIG